MRANLTRILLVACGAGCAMLVQAQTTLDGMPRVADWIDVENQINDMPSQIWGSCDVAQADRVGIQVDYPGGVTGFATYSGLANLWNTAGFAGINPDTSGGFLAGCTGLHFLFNNTSSLPMAWESCSNAFSGNFDLDYNNDGFGSQFRASSGGWGQAHIQTYCSAAAPPIGAVSIPATSPWGLAAVGAGLAALAWFRLRRRAS